MGGPYEAPSLALATNRWLTTTCGQYCFIRMDGGSTLPGGDPPDEAYNLTIDSESLPCMGKISNLSMCIIWEA